MAYESGSFEAAIAAASGEDAELRAQLIDSYVESVLAQVNLLGRARCDGNWEVAAMRLRGLGASFHDGVLVSLAEQALDSAPGDPVAVRHLMDYSAGLTSRS